MVKQKQKPLLVNQNMAKVSNTFINSIVVNSNPITLKILFYIAKNYIHTEVPKDKDIILINIELHKMLSYCNMDKKTLGRNIKILHKTQLLLQDDDKGYESIALLPYAKIEYNGTLQLKMFPTILQQIINVQRRFTIINVQNLAKLKSKHSLKMIQILEMIKGYDSHIPKRKYYTHQELNELFDVKYSRLLEFKRKILEPVKKELDKQSNISFIYQIKYDKEDTSSKGRAKAVGLTIDLIKN